MNTTRRSFLSSIFALLLPWRSKPQFASPLKLTREQEDIFVADCIRRTREMREEFADLEFNRKFFRDSNRFSRYIQARTAKDLLGPGHWLSRI